jgi:hypothetical protein
MEWYNCPLKPETISRLVLKGRMTERDALLLRGTPTTKGFRGRLQESLTWLEDRSPGARARFLGDRMKGWKRNVGPAHVAAFGAALQGRVGHKGFVHPPSKDRCTARSKQTGKQCGHWRMRKEDGSGRYPVCYAHGARAAKFGIRAWRQVMCWDGTQHRKMWMRVRKSTP